MTKPKAQGKSRPDTKQRVAELKASGFSNIEIGKALSLHRDTIAKYIDEIGEKKRVLQAFRSNLGECLHADLLFGMVLKYKLLKSLSEEDITAMSLTDKRQLLRDLSTSNGISYDKIRLQDGKSTNNTSHQMLLELAHKSLAFGPVSSGSETKTPTRNVDHAPPET